MPRPFLAYLRVYEPLATFEEPVARRLRQTLREGPLDRAGAGDRERELWLRSQFAATPRLLPGERADGKPAPNAPQDVLVLQPSDVIGESEVGAGPLVCPLDLRPRSAAALVGFLAGAPATLVEAAVPMPEEAVRSRVGAVMGELSGGAAHVVSSTWTVPLPWFALVEPDTRQRVQAPMDDCRRQACWRMPMGDVLARAVRAKKVVTEAIGVNGPARMLADILRWLEHFDGASAVELDYGGLVQLLDDDALTADTSATDVHAIIDALEKGDGEEVAERYGRLRDFWGAIAAMEHAC
ncbi:MAG: hypothetical protein ACRDRN_19220 [Sciscionella sp.]